MATTKTAIWPDGVDEAYRAPRLPVLVDAPELSYLMIDGRGDPNTSSQYTDAVATLFAVAYAARFDLKRNGVEYKVMPLEGLWATEGASDVWAQRDAWRWTLMIAQPDAVAGEVLDRALAKAAQKRPAQSVDLVRLERMGEGRVAQVLHVGPYGEAERPSVEALHGFIAEQGLHERGLHHEIYLSDARRTAPERLRTLLRQPVDG
jgi:hypothetical protein